jgi:hypothetical protein
MNDKVKEILDIYNEGLMSEEKLHKYLIEICELQKQECAKVYTLSSNQKKVLKRKNIAE